MRKGRRLNTITAILKINAGCSILISDCTDKAGQGQRGAENRVQKRRLQELKKSERLSAPRSASWMQDTGTGCSPELKCSTSSSHGPLTNS